MAEPAESEWHPGCQKDQKSAQEYALPAQVIGRADGGLSERTRMVQGEPAPSAYDRTIGRAPTRLAEDYFGAKRQMPVNARKFCSHFGKIQLENVAGH